MHVLRFCLFTALALCALGSTAADSKAPAAPEHNLLAVMNTSAGVIKLELYADKAPLTVANFVNLSRRGYYNGLTFHRVISDFMIQGGDPTGTGGGGPGYQFRDEFDPTLRHNRAGILSMANAGPGTNGSQFFITHKATPHLDFKHSVFGRVLEGQQVVDNIIKGDRILSIEISGDDSAVLQKAARELQGWNAILDARAQQP